MKEFKDLVPAQPKIIKEYDDRGNLIHYKHSGDYNYEEWSEYDEKNNKIYCNEWGSEFWFKYIRNKKIRITKQEFEERNKIYTKYNRFEIMDI